MVHVGSLGLRAASNRVVLQAARDDGRVLVSADTNFGTLLAASHEAGPSVVLVRRVIGRRVAQLAGLLTANLPQFNEDLRLESIVVIGDDSLRVRRLPIGRRAAGVLALACLGLGGDLVAARARPCRSTATPDAKCISGQEDAARQRIAAALRER